MKILIGCEESQVLTQAFRNKDIDCFSCDLEPTRGNPEWHYQEDIMKVIPMHQWDLIVLHPDCTAMALSGNRWYGVGMPRHQERLDSILWTVELWHLAKEHAPRVALENPASVIFQYLNAPACYVQPWQHGHGQKKRTGFALHNLPPITPTNIVSGRGEKVWKMGPSPTRKRDRSETFTGIADALVSHWLPVLLNADIKQFDLWREAR